jgi:Holliday junction resolvasome RuvABC endonuclease subunit
MFLVMAIVLGLDISTSVVGFSFLDDVSIDHEIKELGHIEFKDTGDIWKKSDMFIETLREAVKRVGKPEAVYIEEALLGFSQGNSNQTLTTLIKFNAICSLLVRQEFGFDPIHVPAPTARKLCGIKTIQVKKCGIPIKKQVFQWALAGPLSNREFPKTRTGTYKPFCYDQVDAYVISYAGTILRNRKT